MLHRHSIAIVHRRAGSLTAPVAKPGPSSATRRCTRQPNAAMLWGNGSNSSSSGGGRATRPPPLSNRRAGTETRSTVHSSGDSQAVSEDSPVVLITGCSDGGIGHALAVAFSSRRCTVYATARRVEAIGQVPAGVQVLPLDVTDTLSVAAAVDVVIGRHGRIDVLINNAGIGCPGPIAETDLQMAKQVYDVNVFGTMAMVQAVAPHMVTRRRGKIVNFGSIVARISPPFRGVYASSKAAVHNMTSALRLEMAPFGVQVMLLAPGAVTSNISRNNKMDKDSLKIFKDYLPFIEQKTSQTGGSMAAGAFAERVAEEVLKEQMCREFSIGDKAALFGILAKLPGWVADNFMAAKFGLNHPAAQSGPPSNS